MSYSLNSPCITFRPPCGEDGTEWLRFVGVVGRESDPVPLYGEAVGAGCTAEAHMRDMASLRETISSCSTRCRVDKCRNRSANICILLCVAVCGSPCICAPDWMSTENIEKQPDRKSRQKESASMHVPRVPNRQSCACETRPRVFSNVKHSDNACTYMRAQRKKEK